MESSQKRTEILKAFVKVGDVETVKSVLQAHQDSYKDKTEPTEILHSAVKHGRFCLITWLLENFDLGVNDKAIAVAVGENNEEMVRFLSRQCKFFRYSLSESLCLACSKQFKNVVAILLEHGARFYAGDKAVEFALEGLVQNDRNDIIDMLLKNHLDFNLESIARFVSSCAIVSGKIEIIKMILSHSSKRQYMKLPFIKTKFNQALKSKNLEILQLFIETNARLFEEEIFNTAQKNQSDELLFLLESGIIDANYQCRIEGGPDGEGWINVRTLLTEALKGGFPDNVELLLSFGADINHEWVNPFSLANACHFKNLKVFVKFMVEKLGEGGYVRERHLQGLKRREVLSSFKKQCESEIEKIKAYKFSNNDTDVSLFKVWKSDLIQLTAYLKNEDIRGPLTPEDLESNFPIYSGRIINKLKKGFERKFRLGQVCNFFGSLSTRKEHRLPRLPAIYVSMVFDSLTTKDLINLRNAYY